MAKRPPKETSTPVIFALVLFVLTTIAFGVMWYMQFSKQEENAAAMADKEKKVAAANALVKEAENNAKLYRVYLGVDEDGDKTSMLGDHKAGDKLATELKRINAALAKKLGLADEAALPDNLKTWTVDAAGKIPETGPTKGIVEVVGNAVTERDSALANEIKTSALYAGAVAEMKKVVTLLDAAKTNFDTVAKALPADFDTKLKAEIAKFDDRKKKFAEAETASRAEITQRDDELGKVNREKTRLSNQISGLQNEIQNLISKAARQSNNTFQYDVPQGKILRRPEPNIVEISIGSNDLVRPGLTFTVLPYDFPEKGRQSRVRVLRIPDERGNYKNVERFVEKATIEVLEVVGPNLSRCRITQEFDPIRDAASTGDLLYNSVWRKGTSDHIALIGIFDVNADGSDDIESVVRDLTKMGIPVDAYFDMKQRKWIGQLTEQTRFIIEGFYPANAPNDPHRDDKTRLISAMSDAIKAGKDKGVNSVKFGDFFPRMGYRVKIDISPDKLNQATAPYLRNDAAAPSPN